MNKLTIVVCWTLIASASLLDDSKNAQIVNYESEILGLNGYKFAYETSDGVTRQEEAQLKNDGTEIEAIVVKGSFSWTAPDGQQYSVTFIADENGYQPEGVHLTV